ncbi:MAG: MarR family transcriptional regulator [Proteobacteria bacterium]|nr:MarR family transcriptional regulator [Pseudomonadota bacterium]
MTKPETKRQTGKRARAYAAIAVLQELADLFDRRRRQLAREAGLSDLQWRVLEEIDGEQFMPSLFARRREQSPAAISRSLRQLHEAGLVRAAIAAGDGRQRNYRLTARGRRLLEELGERREAAIEAVWMPLRAEDLECFRAVGGQVVERLARYEAGERSGPKSARGVRESAGSRN